MVLIVWSPSPLRAILFRQCPRAPTKRDTDHVIGLEKLTVRDKHPRASALTKSFLPLRSRNFISWIYLRRQIDRSGNPRTTCERFTLTHLAGIGVRTFIPFLITTLDSNPESSFSPRVILTKATARKEWSVVLSLCTMCEPSCQNFN